MVILWLIIMVAALLAAGILFSIISQLIDFQIDHINPLDICATLGKYVYPLLYSNIAICVFSALSFSAQTWPILIIHVAIIGYMSRRLRKPRYFEPMTIVRDASKYKTEHVIYMIGSIISALYCFVRLLLEIISK